MPTHRRKWSIICLNCCSCLHAAVKKTCFHPYLTYMQKPILSPAKYALKLILLALLLVPILSSGQKKKTLKPIKGYGETSYTLSASEQYMSAWLVAGPVPVATGANPTMDAQEKSFKDEIPVITVPGKKAVAPLQLNGKQFAWQLIKTSSDIVDLDKYYSA